MSHELSALRKFVLGLALAGMLAPAGAGAATPPKPDILRGDGQTSDFYRWKKDIPAKPGTLLRQETLESTLGLADAAFQYRILFTSTDGLDGKTPTAESGSFFFVPKGTPPKGGWPLVVWGHGTFGGADVCAQSWHLRPYRDVQFLNTWLKEGFAIVAPDYEGLGVPGFNPAFNNRSNAYSLLDSARAVLGSFPDLDKKILLVGQSQGGSAIVAADGYAKAYAPELDLKGAIGTGIVYAVGRPLTPLKPADPNKANEVDPTIAYSFYGTLSEEAVNPAIDPAKIYTPLALPLVDQARTSCLAALENDVALLGLTPANTYRNGSDRGQGDSIVGDTGHKFSTLTFSAPLFIGAGVNDDLAPSGIALAEDACAAGSVVEIHLYPGKDHNGTVNESLKDSVPFAHAVIDGKTITPVCRPAGLAQ